MRILIVEDSPTQSEELKYMLEKHDYVVESARDGQEALAILEGMTPLAVISDVIMPVMGGYELCQHMKKNPRLRNIPVILLTSLSEPENVIKGLECGTDYFMVKPFDEEILVARIAYILANRNLTVDVLPQTSIEIAFREKKYHILSDRLQILNLLISTYETAVHKNRELERVQDELRTEISRREILEDELRTATSAAEAGSRAKSAFLASMSHEIRTPMNAILGFSQLMLIDSAVTREQKERLEIINRSGEHLLALINDILDISKIEAGRITVNTTTFDLHRFLYDIEAMFRVRTEAKNLRLIFEKDANLPRYIATDEGKLRQILINLLGNAVKFTKEGGIAIRAKVEYDDSGKYTFVAEIEDSGNGIDPSDLERIFIAFEQAAGGHEEGGTGLGLALSKEFAVVLNGDITVKSALGSGSCFKLVIEVSGGSGEDVVIVPETRLIVGLETTQEPYRILVVDDKDENRQFLNKVLRSIGFKTQVAANGEDAIQIFEIWKPHLILMDLRMPVMDGFEATRRIKEMPGGVDVPVIIVTATAFEDDIHHLLASGAVAYIRKPFKINEIYEAIGKCIEVTYLYENDVEMRVENEDFTRNMWETLPHELIGQMREATVNAQLDRLLALIDESESIDSGVAKQLRTLANHFQYDTLLVVLQGEAIQYE